MIERLFASSLSVSLILLALAALLAVFAYNAWVARQRGAPRREVPDPGRGSSAADRPGAGRGEPSLNESRRAAGAALQRAGGGDGSGGADSPAAGFLRSDADRSEDGSIDPAAPADDSLAPGRLHPFTDCIVEFHLDEAVASERLLPMAHAFRRVGGKPVILEGSAVHADDPAPPEWAAIAARQRLFRVRVGVLLANRHGPLNAMEYSEFVTGVQTVAEQLSLLGDTPDMPLVLQRARSLDETFAGLDGQIGLNVAAPDPLGLSDLARLAQETGCSTYPARRSRPIPGKKWSPARAIARSGWAGGWSMTRGGIWATPRSSASPSSCASASRRWSMPVCRRGRHWPCACSTEPTERPLPGRRDAALIAGRRRGHRSACPRAGPRVARAPGAL